jgi:hypothetical protein
MAFKMARGKKPAKANRATPSERRHTLYGHLHAHIRFIIAVIVGLVAWQFLPLNNNIRRASNGSGGGLKFAGERIPDYLDFVYFSFVVGTTAQTSDVEVCSRKMRRVVTLHGLLSFFFNTTVIALVVNLTSQLAGSATPPALH